MTRKERLARKQQLLLDIRALHQQLHDMDPNSEAPPELLAECRRLIRERREVGLTEGEHLQAIHGSPAYPTKDC